jgi:hypothetical protein
MIKLEDFLLKRIKWSKKEECLYEPSNRKIEGLYLRLNDFPEEPMFTVLYKGLELDIDDKPKRWAISYDN